MTKSATYMQDVVEYLGLEEAAAGAAWLRRQLERLGSKTSRDGQRRAGGRMADRLDHSPGANLTIREETARIHQAVARAMRDRNEGGAANMTDADAKARQRRRQRIQERMAARILASALEAEESTWIPTSYVVGPGPATCHYCGEGISAEEAILVRESERCHSECEETWRDLVTGERGEARG